MEIKNLNTIASTFDSGLRAYMLKVYNWMFVGILLTGGIAATMFSTGAAAALAASPIIAIAVALSPLAIVFFMGMGRQDPTVQGALFLILASLMGVSLSTVFLTFSLGTVATAFFATAAAFAGLSLFGYVTKIDMSGLGTFLLMALFGLIAVSIINIFIPSALMYNLISGAGVLLFSVLTAYDTQKIKDEYRSGYGGETAAIHGALTLYLDFVNLFLYILRILGAFSSND